MAGEPRPVGGRLALLDPLLGGAPLVVEADDGPVRPGQRLPMRGKLLSFRLTASVETPDCAQIGQVEEEPHPRNPVILEGELD
jgi:hypothetical protein